MRPVLSPWSQPFRASRMKRPSPGAPILALVLLSVRSLQAGAMDCMKMLDPWIWVTSANVVVESGLEGQTFLLPPRAQGADYFGPGQLPDISLHLYEGQLNLSRPFRALFVNGGSGERTLMLATQLNQLDVPHRIVHIDESRTLNQHARNLLDTWSRVHDTPLHVEVLDTSLQQLLDSRRHTPFDYIDYSGMQTPRRVDVAMELRLASRLLEPGRGGLGITLAGGFAAGRRSLDAVKSLVDRSSPLPPSFDDWPEAIHGALQRACSFPRGMKLQYPVLHALAVGLRGLATFQSWEIRPFLKDAGLEFVAPAAPVLYPEEDGSWGAGGAAAAAMGSSLCLSFTDELVRREPWSFEYAVHELYARRGAGAEGGGHGTWELWHHPHDVLVVPRTHSRLQQLRETWAAGKQNLTVTFGPLAPALIISAEPRVGAALLEALGLQVAEMTTVMHGALDVLRKAGYPVRDFAGFDRSVREILATLLGLGWVSLLDGRFLDAGGGGPPAHHHDGTTVGDAPREGSTQAPTAWSEAQCGVGECGAADTDVKPEEEQEYPLAGLGRAVPPLVVVLYNNRTVLGETAEGVVEALGRMGVQALLQADGQEHHHQEALHILLGPDFLSWLPRRYVLYQLENLRTWLRKSPDYLTVASQALAVWEFSFSQLEYWADRGVKATWVPVFVSTPPALPPLADDERQAIDVLFYGSWSRRRAAVKELLQAWAARTGRVIWFQLDYEAMGAKRRALLQRARVVLNIHSLESRVLEVHRINTLLAHGKCVVSEPSSDAALDAKYDEAVVFADLSQMEERLEQLLDDPALRRAHERLGQATVTQMMNDRKTLSHAFESLLLAGSLQHEAATL